MASITTDFGDLSNTVGGNTDSIASLKEKVDLMETQATAHKASLKKTRTRLTKTKLDMDALHEQNMRLHIRAENLERNQLIG